MEIRLEGYKTYIAAGLLLLYAVSGALLGKIDYTVAIQEGLTALGIMGVRHKLTRIAQFR